MRSICGVCVLLTSAVLSSAAHAELAYGGDAAVLGTFTAEQLQAIRGGAEYKRSALFSTDWSSDSRGGTYALGGIGGAIDGVTPGQAGWKTYGGSVNSYNIATTTDLGRAGRALTVSGSKKPNTYRYAFQDLSSQWNARRATDNVLWAEYEQYTPGTDAGSANIAGLTMFDSSNRALAGMGVGYGSGIGSSNPHRSVYGIAYNFGISGFDNYYYRLSGSGAPLANGGWTKFATSFNKSTGVVQWFYSVDGGSSYTGYYINSWAAGASLSTADFRMNNFGLFDNAGATAVFGNLNVYALPTPGAAVLALAGALCSRRRRA